METLDAVPSSTSADAAPVDAAMAAWLEEHGWSVHVGVLARERFDLEALRLASVDVLRLAGIPLGDAVKLHAQLQPRPGVTPSASSDTLLSAAATSSEVLVLREQVAQLQR